MSDDMLRDILEIEREIEANLAAERGKAKAWLEQQKIEIDRQSELELKRSATTASQSSENRCQSARDAGAVRLRQMRRHVKQLQAVSDATLRQMVQRHLTQMFDEVGDDYPDGEN